MNCVEIIIFYTLNILCFARINESVSKKIVQKTMNRYLFIVVSCISVIIATNPYEYTVDNKNYTVHLMDGTTLNNTLSPMEYLLQTNKTYGLGFSVGLDRNNINLYSDPSSFSVRSTPANFTYYFFRDKSKYFIRDHQCNFLCVNPCGESFMSPIRFQHYCKFNIIKNLNNKYSVYASSKSVSITHRILEFDNVENKLRARIVKNANESMMETIPPFQLKNGPILYRGKCVPINKVEQKNLDTTEERCKLNDIVKSTAPTNVDVYVKKDNVKFYKLRLENDQNTAFENGDVFVKNVLQPNVYSLRNVKTCKYVCQNYDCGVYMSDENSNECKIRVEQNEDRNSFFIRFLHNNYYLSYNASVDTMSFSHNTKTRIEFVEAEYKKKLNCKKFEFNANKSPTNKCTKSLGSTLSINLPHLFFFLMLNFTRNTDDIIE
ncbi:FGF-2 [Pieris rapae granulovirus Wuhan]|uniref:FGF-2 n=1 Tax=Pieris rapae granulovirus Wuhan TaxID=2848030 RepID=D2J4S2_9BBAC|nr:FGF-2 [Betabaculovirus arrapae]ACZ63591.1 FGF-2 [Betabaculovirus arrapae]ADO85533.1 fgf-2 [Pieris rapae granulovirus]UOS85779.1 FGF-2 [Pieris rapae granulovirus]